MAFRNIIIESPARLSVKRDQLIIRTEEEHSVPVEDISALLIENKQTVITTAALSRLGQCGCAVYVCDDQYLPCAVLTPFAAHSRELAVAQNQLSASLPLKKRLWQSLVKAKISNQGECLRLAGKPEAAERLFDMAKKVRSGDAENVEAVAAQYYFPALMGADFFRGLDNGINAAMNYGYAILRGSIARHLTAYGLLPVLGIHHHSTLNRFNLADDLIEPFRPVVDLLAVTYFDADTALTPEKKRLLFNCLNLDIRSGDQHHSVAYAIEREVRSLSRSFGEKEVRLCLPELLALKQHRYE